MAKRKESANESKAQTQNEKVVKVEKTTKEVTPESTEGKVEETKPEEVKAEENKVEETKVEENKAEKPEAETPAEETDIEAAKSEENTTETLEDTVEKANKDEATVETTAQSNTEIEVNVTIAETKVKEFPKDGSTLIHKALKLHDTYETLYIDTKFGGLYVPDTFKKSMNKRAVLYKNPYFKK